MLFIQIRSWSKVITNQQLKNQNTTEYESNKINETKQNKCEKKSWEEEKEEERSQKNEISYFWSKSKREGERERERKRKVNSSENLTNLSARSVNHNLVVLV